jgi:hypothetical protein
MVKREGTTAAPEAAPIQVIVNRIAGVCVSLIMSIFTVINHSSDGLGNLANDQRLRRCVSFAVADNRMMVGSFGNDDHCRNHRPH